jgi:hypothetical protein
MHPSSIQVSTLSIHPQAAGVCALRHSGNRWAGRTGDTLLPENLTASQRSSGSAEDRERLLAARFAQMAISRESENAQRGITSPHGVFRYRSTPMPHVLKLYERIGLAPSSEEYPNPIDESVPACKSNQVFRNGLSILCQFPSSPAEPAALKRQAANPLARSRKDGVGDCWQNRRKRRFA